MVDIKEIKRKARIVTVNDTKLTVRVNGGLLKKFGDACKSEGKTMTSVVIALMNEYIDKEAANEHR